MCPIFRLVFLSDFFYLTELFIPFLILVTRFLVVFGDEVTKILRNSLFTFLLSKARLAEQKFKVKKIMQPKWWKNQKWICNEAGINRSWCQFRNSTYVSQYQNWVWSYTKYYISTYSLFFLTYKILDILFKLNLWSSIAPIVDLSQHFLFALKLFDE